MTQICVWHWKQCGTYGMNRFRHDAHFFYIAHCNTLFWNNNNFAHCNKLFWNNTICITCCQLCFISFTVSHDWLWFRRVHPHPLSSCCIGSDSHLMMSYLLSCHSSCYGNRSQVSFRSRNSRLCIMMLLLYIRGVLIGTTCNKLPKSPILSELL